MTTRAIAGRDLGKALRAAQDALRASPPGTYETWDLPDGELLVPAGIAVGAEDRSLALRGGPSTTLVVGAAGLSVTGADVAVAGMRVVGPVRLEAVGRAAVDDVHVRDASGVAAGLHVEGAVAAVTASSVVRAVADPGGHAVGMEVVGTVRASALDVSVRDVAGAQVTGLVARGPAGEVRGLGVSGLAASGAEPVAVDADAGIAVSGVSVERRVDAAALVASLESAQQRLAQARAGTAETWRLPPGRFELAAPLALGAVGRSLRIVGTRSGAGATELVVGAASPVAGDVVALDVVGDRVTIDDLAVQARATGRLVGLRVRADDLAELTDVDVAGLRGASVVGVDADGTTVSLVDVTATDTRSTAGPADGVVVTGTTASLNHVRVDRLRAGGEATGVRATAVGALGATAVEVRTVAGTAAAGMVLRASGAGAELQLLDVTASAVTADAGSVGILSASGGDAALRGVSASEVAGATGSGVIVLAATAVDWAGGAVHDVRGTVGGAVGARVVAVPSQAPVLIADVSIEAVRAATVGAAAGPLEAWRSWLDARASLGDDAAPPLPEPDDVAGLHVCAPVDELEPWFDDADPGPLRVSQCVLRRISGTALQLDGGLRACEVRGVEAWTSVRGGWVGAERVLLAQSTWHRHATGLVIAPCSLTAVDCLFTGIAAGPGLVLDDQVELDEVAATFAAGNAIPFEAPPGQPYRNPGPAAVPASVLTGSLAPAAPVDLRLADDGLHDLAVRVPADDPEVPAFLGAHAPDVDERCDLRDPLPPPRPPGAARAEAGPFVDYRARDARSLLALMVDRSRRVMPGWEPGPADQTTMLLELLANRLDHLSYRQETAVAEGYIGTARLRRSVEDHARLVDYAPDAGLSASTMLRFDLGPDDVTALGLADQVQRPGGLVVPAGTLVVNADATDRLVVFATEAPLPFEESLRVLRLADDATLEAGATSTVLAGDTSALVEGDLDRLAEGRWLVIVAVDPDSPGDLTDPGVPSHVVRVTRVERGGATARVFWDPRRPAPARYERTTSRIYGNVVPAHHGLPLTPLATRGEAAVRQVADVLRPWRERLTIAVRHAATVKEIVLPMGPVSVQARGWPFPGEAPRSGRPRIEMSVDGEPWALVPDLAVQAPGDECFVVRAGDEGAAAVRVGDGITGAPFPARDVSVDLSVRIGLGAVGNVRAGAITQLLALGEGEDAGALLGGGDDDPGERMELLRRHLRIVNPVPGIGGRDPEPLERIRYRAPLGVRDVLSAVVPADFERLLAALPEVAASRARVIDAGQRPLVQVTLLLRDEDRLAGLGAQGEAERLRRWAVARAHLESVRLLGYDVELVPPRFVPLDLDVVVDAAPWATAATVERDLREALGGPGGLFDPDVAGLGGDVHLDAIHRRARAVPGVHAVRVNRMRRLAPRAVDHVASGVLPMAADEVAILSHPFGEGFPDGLLTVQVCEAVA